MMALLDYITLAFLVFLSLFCLSLGVSFLEIWRLAFDFSSGGIHLRHHHHQHYHHQHYHHHREPVSLSLAIST